MQEAFEDAPPEPPLRGADWSKIAAAIEPEGENTEIYDELYRIYRELYPATREQMHNLADMQNRGGGVA